MDQSFLTFHIGSYFLGVSADNLLEVNRNLKYTKIPDGPKTICGILNLRGSMMPIINLGSYLQIADAQDGSFCIILKIENHDIALMVDSIGDIATFNTNDFSPCPMQLSDEFQKTILGAFRLPKGLLIALDISAIFSNTHNIDNTSLSEISMNSEKIMNN